MEAKRPMCVITIYDEETKTVSYRHVAQAAVADAIAKASPAEVPLADFDYKVDDEFARKLGAMILVLLSGRSPFLKDHMSITMAGDGDEDPPKKPSWWQRK